MTCRAKVEVTVDTLVASPTCLRTKPLLGSSVKSWATFEIWVPPLHNNGSRRQWCRHPEASEASGCPGGADGIPVD